MVDKPKVVDAADFFRASAARPAQSVYSTEQGDLRKSRASDTANKSRASASATVNIPDGKSIRVSRESKGRGGKVVTLIRGLPLAAEALKELCKSLKNTLGTGGTVVDGTIELQGDRRDDVVSLLQQQGYAAKLG
jgi:translation initiation factor 1